MTVAVVILASIMGVAALAGLLVMAMAGAATLLIAWRQNGFQGKIMEARDRRMKGFNESLHNMKVGHRGDRQRFWINFCVGD